MSQEMITVTIDGKQVEVAKGTLVIRAAEAAGIRIPRFCDHPLLEPVGACRQCLVEVAMPARDGVVRPMPKPQAACTMTCGPQMEVKTAATSEVARKAQNGVTEFLLINHPLDCPICDKGGECPLQNQAMSGGLHTRFTGKKRVWPKPIQLTSQILLDRERCVLCQRCVRFADQIAGDAFIDLQGRGGGSSPVDHHDFMGENIGAYDPALLELHDSKYASECGPAGGISCGCGSEQGEGVKGTDPVRLPADAVLDMSDGSGKPAPRSHEAALLAGPAELDEGGRLFASYFSGNVIQICPVGALTSKQYRFRARPFDLASTRSVTEHDASGSAIRYDVRRGEVTRRMAQRDMEVNEEWITDKDRFAFTWQFGDKRLKQPLYREQKDAQLEPVSSVLAYEAAAKQLSGINPERIGFLPGGRLTFEDAYAWGKFARAIAGTNNIDQRVRGCSTEEETFLGAYVAGSGLAFTYNELEKAPQVLLIGFEPEDECGSVFLRLRKASRKGAIKVATVAPYQSASSFKSNAEVFYAAPGTEPEVIGAIKEGASENYGETFARLAEEGSVIVVGERASEIPGLLAAVEDLAARSGAQLVWIPRRSGERGGVEAGLLPSLLPFGRPAQDAAARQSVSKVWGCELPETPGLNALELLEKAAAGELDALVLGGVDLRDFPNPDLAAQALAKVPFVLSLEVNATQASELADLVIPVAPHAEKPGTFINWEGRLRPFGQALVSNQPTDRDVLNNVAARMGLELGLGTLKELHAEANLLLEWEGDRVEFAPAAVVALPVPGVGQAVLATHKQMLDDGLTQLGDADLAASARASLARISPETAAELGISDGGMVKISSSAGAIVLPVVFTRMPRSVVWVPQCSPGSHVYETLRVGTGALVSLAASEVTAE